MLELDAVSAGYGRLQVVHEIELTVGEGELVALVGANGAGKSTTLRAISALLRPTAGSVRFRGERIDRLRPHQVTRRGLVHVPEDRGLFGGMTVEENLRMGAWTTKGATVKQDLARVHELFPILAERAGQAAETLSGGQQQMVAIGRALMARPALLMLDEPSTGLSPKLTWEVFDAVKAVRDSGVAVLLVEQNAHQTLTIADRAYVLESGTTVLHGNGPELAGDPRVRKAYLGL
ncbi:branched-chain amino acid transport system ATP-binding protein [Jatrophihabitans endophyticus]|uniref:Branched-chain amino acid transport system ATP-binding protein n=1 Tax=Jatrophihabitans endophyticus TaxID=1206085 RepID=A0A1M5M114_9ACTN|nr:ABC transporter ATP-binding protein [Jatrophihabitans endophyticus]SHG70589.1 branched-chain amino acid transport system ATP-binding protein [Jatrophihabitans endophyticus]